LAVSRVHEIQHQVSEEMTVSRQRGRLSWIGGVFLFTEVDRQPTVVELGGARLGNHLDPKVDASSAAGFGQGTLSLTSRVSVTGGLRYSREKKTIDNSGRLLTLDLPVVQLAGAYAYSDAISHTAWTPKAELEVQTGRQALAYVSATRGFKSGGFNLTSPQAGRGYDPEFAWSYEGGFKTSVVNGRTRLSVAGFHTDYTNLQVQTAILPGVIDISNAAAATIQGVEFESVSNLSRSWLAGGHVTWLDSTYDRYTAVGVGGVTGDVAGNRLNNAPEWSGRLWVEWRPGGSGALSVRADSRSQSTVFFTSFNDAIQTQGAYGLLDASVEFSPNRRLTIGMYARNLTNQTFITGAFSSPPPAIGGRPGESRRVSVGVIIDPLGG
jgi:iron complex outermembrane receptor protein